MFWIQEQLLEQVLVVLIRLVKCYRQFLEWVELLEPLLQEVKHLKVTSLHT